MFAATRLGTSLGEYYYRYMWVVAEGCSFFCTGWSLVWLMGREILIESTVIGFFFNGVCFTDKCTSFDHGEGGEGTGDCTHIRLVGKFIFRRW